MFSASVNQRLAAIRSLMKLSHRLGFCATDGRGVIDSEKAEAYRDTRGTDLANIQRLLALPNKATVRGKRDDAILRLLCVKALRRAEVCSLDVQHFNDGEGRLDILGKGESDRREISLPPHCAQAIRTYLAAAGHAGDPDAPLIKNCDRNPKMAGG